MKRKTSSSIDRTQAGHLVEVFLPEEIRPAPQENPPPSCLGRRHGSSSSSIEEMDFFERFSRREAIHVREGGRCFYCLRRFLIRLIPTRIAPS